MRLAFLAAATRSTGRLLIESDRATYEIAIRHGTAVHVSSDDGRDDLAAYLVASGAADAAVVAAASRASTGLAGDLVALLATYGAIDPADGFRRIREHALTVIARALAVTAGRGFWEPGAEVPAGSFPICRRAGVLVEAVRRFDAELVRERVRAVSTRAVSRIGGRLPLAHLELSPWEARVLALFDGARSIRELATEYPSDADTIHRVALLLSETDLLSIGSERPTAVPTPAAPARTPTPLPTPAAATGTATTVSAATSSRRMPTPPLGTLRPGPPLAAGRLRVLAEQLRTADHFEALGVTRDAAPATLLAAYVQLAKRLQPGVAGDADDGPLRAELLARISAAWTVLSNPATRAKYAAEIATSPPGRAAIAVMEKRSGS